MKIFKLRLFDFLIITLFIPIYLYDPKISNVFSNKEKFVIANINGNKNINGAGLGNQFFTFSFAYTYAKKIGAKKIFIKNIANCENKTEDFKDISKRCYGLHKFGINYPIIDDLNTFKKKYNVSTHEIYQVNQLKQLNPTNQSYFYKAFIISPTFDSKMPRFFKEYKDEIKKLFIYKESLSKNAKKILNQIKTSDSISIHIRRNDFINRKWVFPLSYQIQAAHVLATKITNPTFFIFSDDQEYTKKYFNNINNIKMALHFADMNYINKIYKMLNNDAIYVSKEINHSLEEFHLMSQCKHNIIPNSTFSWWASFLNKNPNKIVIAPLSAPIEQLNPEPPEGENWIQIDPYYTDRT